MGKTGLSIPAIVDSIITHNQPVNACLKQKIVNYHALATLIKPEVEKIAGRRTTVNTLVVAIKRFSDSIDRKREGFEPPMNTLKDATITLTSDVADVTIRPKKSEFPAILKKIIDISSRLDEFPDILKSSNLIKLVADEKEYESKLRSELRKNGDDYVVRELTGLSRLTIHLSPEAEGNDPSFPLFISELLYRQGVKIIHSYIDEDTIVIVDRSDGPRAYEIIQEEIVRTKHEFLEEQQFKKQAKSRKR
ncbi:MAG TPA: hypothetical protein VJN71_10805 [Nitrososphaerales archaeon]|nr:hypothetical protein [Nitrososphaerales archaeon]